MRKYVGEVFISPRWLESFGPRDGGTGKVCVAMEKETDGGNQGTEGFAARGDGESCEVAGGIRGWQEVMQQVAWRVKEALEARETSLSSLIPPFPAASDLGFPDPSYPVLVILHPHAVHISASLYI